MKKYFKFLFVLILFTALPVFASSNNLFRSDDNINVNEDLNGSGFIAGNNVDVDSKVDGILFAAGNSVTSSGESDYAFIAGNIVKVSKEKIKDGFIAGNAVDIKEIDVERDLYVASSKTTFEGTVGRNMFLASGSVIINGTVKGDITIYSENITIDDNAVISGTLKYFEGSKVNVSKSAKIGKTKVEKNNNSFVNTKQSFKARISNNILSLTNILLIGLIMMLLMPKTFEKISTLDSKSILTNLGFGFITLIVAPIAALILITTLIGISTGFILLTLYCLSLYISMVFTSYYLSNIFLNKKLSNKYLIYLIGAVVITILKTIPFIQTLTTICTLCLGLGIIVNLLFNRK